MNIKNYSLIPLLLLFSGQTYGATELELTSERTVDGVKNAYTVKALYDKEKSRFTFYGKGDGGPGAGSYLLSLDGGETAYYIDPGENT